MAPGGVGSGRHRPLSQDHGTKAKRLATTIVELPMIPQRRPRAPDEISTEDTVHSYPLYRMVRRGLPSRESALR
jgi:hypothetical protein